MLRVDEKALALLALLLEGRQPSRRQTPPGPSLTTRTAVFGLSLLTLERVDSSRRRLGADPTSWVTDRGHALVREIQHNLGDHTRWSARDRQTAIRYTPITESYRALVDLSLSVLNQRPLTSAAAGGQKVFGVLIDMAEVWELYVAKVLKLGLPNFQVFHTGRNKEHFRWLLRSEIDDDKLGSMRPDIVITDRPEHCVAIADAKYKTTAINGRRLTGVAREDLYQLAAYLSGFGSPDARLDGFLIYPTEDRGEVGKRLSLKNPWIMSSAANRRLWFLSIDPVDHQTRGLGDSERNVALVVNAAVRAESGPPFGIASTTSGA